MSEILYLDLCGFKRPVDESIDRNRREAEAVAAILNATEKGALKGLMMSSQMSLYQRHEIFDSVTLKELETEISRSGD